MQYMNTTPIPKGFGYRDIICECLNFKSSGTDIIFIGRINPTIDHTIALEEYMDDLPDDVIFRMKVSMYYKVAVFKVTAQIMIDEEEAGPRLYIHCYSCWNTECFSQVNRQLLFMTFVREHANNVITSYDHPVNLHNLKTIGDEGDGITMDISVSTTAYRTPSSGAHKFMQMYGCSVDATISNINAIHKEIPDYDLQKHDSFLMMIGNEMVDALSNVRDDIDPENTMQLGAAIIPVFVGSTKNSISFLAVFQITHIRGLEIYDVAPHGIIWRKLEDNALLKPDYGYNWKNGYAAACRLITSMTSAPGMLYIPSGDDRGIDTYDNMQYHRVDVVPHVVLFNKNPSFDGSDTLDACKDESWCMVNECLNGNLQLAYPIMLQFADPWVLQYGRVNRSYFYTPQLQVQTVNLLTSNHINMRYICSDNYWIYFALTDDTYDISTQDDRTFANPFWKSIGQCMDNSDQMAITILLASFLDCPDIDSALHIFDGQPFTPIWEACDQNVVLLLCHIWAATNHIRHRGDAYVKAYTNAARGLYQSLQKDDPGCAKRFALAHEYISQRLAAEETLAKKPAERETLNVEIPIIPKEKDEPKGFFHTLFR